MRFLWRLEEFEFEYQARASKAVVVRWWYRGTLMRSRTPIRLVPAPKEWDDFLDWATRRGYLKRVGYQHVWLHDALRTWFEAYQDERGLALLLGPEPSRSAPQSGASILRTGKR